MTTLLIDGDIFVYRAGFATDKTVYVVQGASNQMDFVWTPFPDAVTAKKFIADTHNGILWSRKETEPEDKALMLVDVMLGDVRAHYAAENPDLIVYLTGVGNFRNGIATRATYKGNRSGSVPPTHLKAIRAHLLSKWNAVLSNGEEADDLIAIEASRTKDAVIVTVDKDLRQVPGRFYDFVKKEEVTISAKEGWLNFYSQVLSGDPTDNVLGVTGLGPVKSRKALEGCKNNRACWLKCVELYTAEFGPDLGPKYALETARLVYVRRTVGDMFNAPSATKELQAA